MVIKFNNAEKLGFSYVLKEYFDRYMQDYKKTTSLFLFILTENPCYQL